MFLIFDLYSFRESIKLATDETETKLLFSYYLARKM
jgi:hypothetical protein